MELLTRDSSLPKVGPGSSARMMKMPLEPKVGKMLTMKTNIPIPPKSRLKLRQKSRERGKLVRLARRTLAPVVEKPLVDSKRASVKEVTAPLKIKGKAPASEMSPMPERPKLYLRGHKRNHPPGVCNLKPADHSAEGDAIDESQNDLG